MTIILIGLALLLPMGYACAQTTNRTEKLVASGKSVLPDDPLFAYPVGGLERTDASQETIPVTGTAFTRALRVTIKKDSDETNATQLTINNTEVIQKGEALVASFSVRGRKANDSSPAELMFLFEKSTNPWTKSVSYHVDAPKDGTSWKHIAIPFTAAEGYGPGEVMASLRFAFGPQTIDVADLKVVSLGMGKSVDEIQQLAADLNPLGSATVTIDWKDKRQVMEGFGGDYCQARYGSTEKIDPVGQYTLDHLQVVAARVGLPLNYWTPERGVYKDDGQAKAALELLQEMAKRHIPTIATVWEGPQWLLPGQPESSGRVLDPAKYDDCIAAIVQFLVTARDKYKAPVDFFSFNEADYGVNFKFSSSDIAAFIKKAGPAFVAAGLKTKFLVADTANGNHLAGYAAPLLADKELAPYLGPIAFHSWDALEVQDSAYTAIATLGKQYNKPIWCTEAGHDSQLWQKPNPWPTWQNALSLAAAYARTLRLSGAAVMLYWTYQDNYPLLSEDAKTIYPAFQAVQMIQYAFPKGATICASSSDSDAVNVVAALQPGGKGETVLLVNSSGVGAITLKGLPGAKKATITTLKSDADKAASRKVAYPKGDVVLSVPARSITVLRLD